MRIGDRVLFGRPNGEQSLGEVIKINTITVKVKALEARLTGQGSIPGAIWTVDKSLCRPVETGEQSVPATAPAAPVAPSERILDRALAKLTNEERTAVAMFYRSRIVT